MAARPATPTREVKDLSPKDTRVSYYSPQYINYMGIVNVL